MNTALQNREPVTARATASVVLPNMLDGKRDGSSIADLDLCSETTRVCCGREMRSFWAEDGFFKSVCMQCGQTFVDITQVRYRGTPWIGVDLDGTLASDVGSWGDGKIGNPIPAMATRVKKWVAEGITVKVFTARASSPKQVTAIKKWLAQHNLPDLEITNVKDRLMIELWDDRCVQVSYNTGQPVNRKTPSATRKWLGSGSNLRRPAAIGLLSRFKIFFTL